MVIERINLENFTTFKKVEVRFSPGLNVIIGNNGTGKTHILKVLYAAIKSAQVERTNIDFVGKLVNVFRPDGFALHRLSTRGLGAVKTKITIQSQEGSKLRLEYDSKKKSDVKTIGADRWKSEFQNASCTFIPAKEILSHSRNLIQAISSGNVDFDDTYKDIISAASVDISRGPDSAKKKRYLKRIQSIIEGRVKMEDEEFYLIPTGKTGKLEFQLVAEGMRKLALLWQLIKNGTLENGSVLFWDEPEANVNPSNIPELVDLLLDLQEDGVQIFITTHDYFFAKYVEMKMSDVNSVGFYSFYRGEDSEINCESSDTFTGLENNSIISEQYNIYKNQISRVMD